MLILTYMEEVSETVILLPDKNINTPTSLNVKQKRKFFHGGEKEKWQIEAVVGKNSDMQISIVERNFKDKTDEILEKWIFCNTHRMSVVPFMKKTTEGTIVMPNLSKDGVFFMVKVYMAISWVVMVK